MSYDDDYERGRRPNATCPECRNDFYRSPNDTGYLCDHCLDRQDQAREARRVQRDVCDATFVRAVQNFHSRAAR